jgi:hypothetical protein
MGWGITEGRSGRANLQNRGDGPPMGERAPGVEVSFDEVGGPGGAGPCPQRPERRLVGLVREHRDQQRQTGQTTIAGPSGRHGALHGLLSKGRDLGLECIGRRRESAARVS